MTLDWKDDPHITNRSFRLVDLLNRNDLITGRTFEECTIYGPAVLAPLYKNIFDECIFEGDPNALIWEVPEERNQVIGAIGAQQCVFRRCNFRGIGIAGKRELVEQFLNALGGTSSPPDEAADVEPLDV